MDKLFWGFFFLFLNFSLNMNGAVLQLLPDWLGFILLYLACGELLGESELFGRPRPFCAGLAVCSGIVWVIDLLAVGVNPGIAGRLLGLVAVCLRLYVSMLIVDALSNVEMRRNYDLCAAHLRKVWKVLAVTTLAAYVLLIVPAAAVLCIVASAVTGILFLVAVHGTRKAWRSMLLEQSKPF